jgi:hypothetical protein
MKKFLVFMICMLFVFVIPFSVYATDSAITAPEAPIKNGSEGSVTTLLSEKFEEWVVPHIEEISVIITLICTAFYNMRKHKLLNKSIGTMNNNTITIAEQSSNMMTQAIQGMENTSVAVMGYDERIAEMLAAYKSTAEDKEKLEKELAELKVYLAKSAQANIEFSNELAELLALANIPNYKKEEIGARHMAAVRSITNAESDVAHTEEVIHDVGEKA